MASEWHKGVLNQSSWHGLEQVGVMKDANEMVLAGSRSLAWPTQVYSNELTAKWGDKTITIPGNGVMGQYADGSIAGLGRASEDYKPTTPEQWQHLIRAACEAGARPTGAFALRGGSRMLATFEVGDNNGIRTNLVMADSFDTTLRLLFGSTSIRVVCANTLHAAMRSDGQDWALIRHVGDMQKKVEQLAKAVDKAIKSGETVKEAYSAAMEKPLSRVDVNSILDRLFPVPAAEETNKERAVKTKAINRRVEAIEAMARPENQAGATLATVWNASTWLVDRNPDGTHRSGRNGSDTLDSLLFGTRAKRLQEIEHVVQVILKDGSVVDMPSAEYAHREAEEDDGGLSALLSRPVKRPTEDQPI